MPETKLQIRECTGNDTAILRRAFGLSPRAQYQISAYTKTGFFALYYPSDTGYLPRFVAAVVRVETFRPDELTITNLWADPATPVEDLRAFLQDWAAYLGPTCTLALDARPLVAREDYTLAAMYRELSNLESHESTPFVYRRLHPFGRGGCGSERSAEPWAEAPEPVQPGGPPGDGGPTRVPNPV